MSYESALCAAGADVHGFKEFGSYQGDWWAHLTYSGVTGWVTGSYGSCSGCDAFEAEFGWNDDKEPDYQERLAKFGAEYLDRVLTDTEALAEAGRHSSWDCEADEMVSWIQSRIEKKEIN